MDIDTQIARLCTAINNIDRTVEDLERQIAEQLEQRQILEADLAEARWTLEGI